MSCCIRHGFACPRCSPQQFVSVFAPRETAVMQAHGGQNVTDQVLSEPLRHASGIKH